MHHEHSSKMGGFIASLVFFMLSVFVTFGALFLYRPLPSPIAKHIKTEKKLRQPRSLLVAEMSNAFLIEEKAHDNAVSKFAQMSQKTAGEEEPNPMTHHEDLDRAMALVDGGKIKEALSLLEEILQKDPNNEMALIEIGMIYIIDFKSPQKAMGYLEHALRINPLNSVVASELSELYTTARMGEQGINFFKNIYEKNPANHFLASEIGKMLSSEKRYQEAIPYLEGALSQEASPMLRADLAAAYARTGHSEKAILEYKRAIAQEEQRIHKEQVDGEFGVTSQMHQDSKEVIATMNLAIAQEYFKMGRESEAKELVGNVKRLVGDGIAKIYQENKDRIFE